MNKFRPLYLGLINAFGVLVYTSVVSLVLFNGEKLFGQDESFFIPLTMLMLFVFSATIVGLLVLGRPIYLYFEGFKKEGVALLLYTVGWLFVMIVITLGAHLLIK